MIRAFIADRVKTPVSVHQLWAKRGFSSYCWKVDSRGLVSKESDNPLYQVIVGLEIHAQLHIPTKLFSPASTTSIITSIPNRPGSVHPFDLATPGYLPRLSQAAVHAAILAAAALNCQIAPVSRFERKHYAYADLPAGYQITQQRWPLAVNGAVTCNNNNNGPGSTTATHKRKKKRKQQQTNNITCRVNRIQLEQDTAKTTTVTRRLDNDNNVQILQDSLVDFTRAGNALIEIVLEPDLRSGPQASAVVSHIRQLLSHVGVCQGRMELGQLRVDCNVNLERLEDGVRSPRVEVKNLNSMQQVAAATEYEALRQATDWENDKGTGLAETRTWDAAQSKTILIRRKDGEDDYRFLPEPDLPPLVLNATTLNGLSLDEFIAEKLPELPTEAIKRLQESYGLSSYQASVIAGDPPAVGFFDSVMTSATRQNDKEFAKLAANLLCNELFALIKEETDDESDASVDQSHVSSTQLGEIVLLLQEGSISSAIAKRLLTILYMEEQGASPRQVAAARGFELISDPERLRQICQKVIDDHPEQVEEYKQGQTRLRKLFIGKAMAASRGNAHPERLQEALAQVLEETAPEVK